MKKQLVALGGLIRLGFCALFIANPAISADFHDVIINEIAWMGTDASTADEWIELYNTTDSEIDLTGWTLASTDEEPTISISDTIPAHGYLLLERTDDNTVSDSLADLIYSGTLSNSGEYLQLKDETGQVIDEVDCSGGWFGGTSTPKASMERVHPETDGSDPGSWGTNDGVTINGNDADGNPINGTPKAQNSVHALSSVRSSPLLPEGCALFCNYPNPFNPATTIRYVISEERAFHRTSLTIYDVMGREVLTLIDRVHAPGVYWVSWDGCDAKGMEVASGVYFYLLSSGGQVVETKCMVKIE